MHRITASQELNPEVAALKEELQRTRLAYQMASEMSLFKAGFLARVSHELRSPLNSLIGLQQLILSDLCEDAAEEREFIAQSNKAAMKMVSLIDEILNVARTEHGTNKLDIHPIQLAFILAQIEQLTRLPAFDRNLSVEIESIDPQIYVLADPRWLQQVLLNLVDTPLKLMREGSVSVSVHPDPNSGYVHIWVEDRSTVNAWSEPINLLQSAPKTDEQSDGNFILSPGMTLLINQTLLELMKGRLELLAISSSDDPSSFTRIQCSIPLITP